jgi:hypothetical protein
MNRLVSIVILLGGGALNAADPGGEAAFREKVAPC